MKTLSLAAALPPANLDVAAALRQSRAFYDQHADSYCRTTEGLDLTRFYDRFLEHVQPAGQILDAGCGSGRDSLAFQASGFAVVSIDASPEMVRQARARGVPAQALSFQELRFTDEFDGIWACASLVHVPRTEIVAVLRRFAVALKPGGAVFASIRQGGGEAIASDGRFFAYFEADEFCAYAREAGLEVVEVLRPDVDDWMQFVFRRPTGDRHPLAA